MADTRLPYPPRIKPRCDECPIAPLLVYVDTRHSKTGDDDRLYRCPQCEQVWRFTWSPPTRTKYPKRYCRFGGE